MTSKELDKASKKYKLRQHLVKAYLRTYERALVDGRGSAEFANFPLGIRLEALTMRATKRGFSKKSETRFLGFIASMESDLRRAEDAGDSELALRIRETIDSYRKLHKQPI